MNTNYLFQSNNRDYSEWSLNQTLELNIDPISHKLFSGDQFSLSENGTVIIVYSPIRTNKSIPGVLLLHGTQTYGRTKNGRILYKCIPFDNTLPTFLLPYDIKIGFNKLQVNKYILFSFSDWNNKHPSGIITETIGDVDDFKSFCTYQLWTHNLMHSITKFNKELNRKLNNICDIDIIQSICSDSQYCIEDHTNEYVFTIDPVGSVDLDDGFSIRQSISNSNELIVSIHIANVYACIDKLQLWEYMTPRVSTIYFPDDRKTMLPTALSDRICSLLEHQIRITFAMEVAVDKNTGIVRNGSTRFFNAVVNICKNFRYEEKSLLKNPNYKLLHDITRKLDATLVDSHDVVSFWMVYMNSMSASQLHSHKTGVFRSVISQSPVTPLSADIIDDCETRRVLVSWKNTHSSYKLYDESLDLRHNTLNVDSYVHITSPIRRMVDVLNQICFNKSIFNITLSDKASRFLSTNLSQIDELNKDVKSIQRVQMDCNMLHLCIYDPEVTNSIHSGIVFNKNMVSDNNYRYTVYLKSVKRMYMFDTTEILDHYSTHNFKILLFDTENTGHRKMRVALLV
jgi:exoribonuclease R